MNTDQPDSKASKFAVPYATVLSRRNFLKTAGTGAAALALRANALAEVFQHCSGQGLHIEKLAHTHDLASLPEWGPYSKKYFGISHIPDVSCGLSFDLSVFPTLTRGPVRLPSVTEQSGVHPWQASPALDFYSLRMEMIWKDQLYCDLSFSRIDSRSRLVRLEIVNQTALPREIGLNCLAQLTFPPVRELTPEPIQLCDIELPPTGMWAHALDYADLQFAKTRPTDNLVADGKWRGEERGHNYVGGSVVAQKFGRDPGDRIFYRLRVDRPFSDAKLIWRYRLDKSENVTFLMDGIVRREIAFQGTGELSTVSIPLGPMPAGVHELRFTSKGGAPIALNGFALVESEQADRVRFVAKPWHPVPYITSTKDGLILKYQDIPNYYGILLGQPGAGHRLLKWQELDSAFGNVSAPATRDRIFGNGHGRTGDPESLFTHTFSSPFSVAPQSRRIVYGVVCTGSETEVRRSLEKFHPQSAKNGRIYLAASQEAFRFLSTSRGEQFRLSQQLMAATTLTNLVYPLYTQREYIRHYSPGRTWDCLYTWDAGFTGLGLLELDTRCATEFLNAYTTAPGSQSAFIHHGTPLPVQIYLWYELWNRTQSLEMLAYFYPRLRQYYRFLAGRLGSSTTRRNRDHLICTWNYFYNSGGWDDYPPQKFAHEHDLIARVAPVISSSHIIRCAKLLRLAAAELGRNHDIAEYDQDITELAASLQQYSWDKESGYYGYVLHDEQGNPKGILRDSNGANFNMGLDGVCPLIAGICSPEQQERILDHLFSTRHLWTDIGITTVDQSAPYYNPNGYWNGSVWLAHQWFLWKTMLDLGRGDLAYRIAQTGLNLWKHVADTSYDCMEHFVPRAPFGEGWSQFTSLSSPVLSWFAALYTQGRLTCGFDAWLHQGKFRHDNRQLQAKLSFDIDHSGRYSSVLICMNPDAEYRVRWKGESVNFSRLHDGVLQVQLPAESTPGELLVSASV